MQIQPTERRSIIHDVTRIHVIVYDDDHSTITDYETDDIKDDERAQGSLGIDS